MDRARLSLRAFLLAAASGLLASCGNTIAETTESASRPETDSMRPASEPGVLRVGNNSAFDLGVIEKGGERLAIVWLANDSQSDVDFERVSASCDCLQVVAAESVIESRGRIPIAIHFQDDPADSFAGDLGVELTLVGSEGKRHSAGTVNLSVSADADVGELRRLASDAFGDAGQLGFVATE